ncbi:hypothetical protein BDN70DRAFT_883633 [Pholiota conissans]|uniref:Uncharacterized protein n=1 Tax=Pholiota conissans TaxID=109636 RepID=A0A9P6CXF4_9AGAR|nr:hypothetical protein BDN70DRAFT_883633 [Pholiota conissans]
MNLSFLRGPINNSVVNAVPLCSQACSSRILVDLERSARYECPEDEYTPISAIWTSSELVEMFVWVSHSTHTVGNGYKRRLRL